MYGWFHRHLMLLHPPGVIERWELLQAQDLSKEIRTKQNQQQWQQLNSDLNKIWAWLGETEEELEQQQRLELCTDIQTIEQRIKKLKVLRSSGCIPNVVELSLTFLLMLKLFAWLKCSISLHLWRILYIYEINNLFWLFWILKKIKPVCTGAAESV